MKIKKVNEMANESQEDFLKLKLKNILEDDENEYLEDIFYSLSELDDAITSSVMDIDDDKLESEAVRKIYQSIIEYLSNVKL